MNKTIKIAAIIKLNEHFNRFFKFPILNPIRISFWVDTPIECTPSEIHFKKRIEATDIGLSLEADVFIIYWDYLADKLKANANFYIGNSGVSGVEGIIISIEDVVHLPEKPICQ